MAARSAAATRAWARRASRRDAVASRAAGDDVPKPLFRLPEGLSCATRGTASRRLADAPASPSPPLLALGSRSSTEHVAISQIGSYRSCPDYELVKDLFLRGEGGQG